MPESAGDEVNQFSFVSFSFGRNAVAAVTPGGFSSPSSQAGVQEALCSLCSCWYLPWAGGMDYSLRGGRLLSPAVSDCALAVCCSQPPMQPELLPAETPSDLRPLPSFTEMLSASQPVLQHLHSPVQVRKHLREPVP